MVDGKSLCGEEQVGVSVDDDGVPGGGAQGGQACPYHPPSSCPGCLHPCCRPGNVLEIPLKTLLQGETLMSMSMGSFPNLTSQGMLARYGPAKYRFSRNYQATGLGFGSNKVSKVSFCFFCIFLQNPVLGDQVY